MTERTMSRADGRIIAEAASDLADKALSWKARALAAEAKLAASTPPAADAAMAEALEDIMLIVEDEAYKVTDGQKPCKHTAALNEVHDRARQALASRQPAGVGVPSAADRVTCRKTPEISVKDAGEALPAEVWRKALACGDQLDRFPCQQCGATNPSKCINPITPAQVEATRDYVNGYGWKAAYALPAAPATDAGERA